MQKEMMIGTILTVVIFRCTFAAVPDTALKQMDRSFEAISGPEAFSSLEIKQGTWIFKDGQLLAGEPQSPHGRALLKSHQWIDCVLRARITLDSAEQKPGSGMGLLLRAQESGAAVIGLSFGSQAFTIGQLSGDQWNTIVQAPMRIELGRAYHITVVADRAVYFCYIDGQFILKAQDSKSIDRPAGHVGFYSANATGRIVDLDVHSLKRSTSPFKFYDSNPLNVEAYSPTVTVDGGRFKMWHTVQGNEGTGQAYAESADGIHWDQPHGTAPVKPVLPKGSWGDGGEADAAVVRFGNEFLMWYPGRTTPAGDNWDGLGMFRSGDGIQWRPEPGNPQFYMGPLGSWEAGVVGEPCVIRDGDIWKMWYVALNQPEYGYLAQFGYAESQDGVHWRKSTLNPVFPVGEPGEWDSGWVTRSSVLKLEDDETQTRVYAGRGGSYHLFYTGHTSNDEFIAGVKRMGWAFSLDGVNWVRYDDPNTTDPPFHKSDPILPWTQWGDWGFEGVRACSAVRSGDEVRIWMSGGAGYGGHFGTGLATAKVGDLLEIVKKAKAAGKLKQMSRREIESTLHDPLPLSTWDDLAGFILAAASARATGDEARTAAVLKTADETILKNLTRSERAYLRTTLKPLRSALSFLRKGGKPVVTKPWALDFSTETAANGCSMHSVSFKGVSDGSAVFQATGSDPYITLPGVDFRADAGLQVVEIDATFSKVAAWHGGVSIRWSLDGGEFAPTQSVRELVRFPEKHHLLRAVMSWPEGAHVTGIRLYLTPEDRVIIRHATVHVVEFK